MTSKSGGAGRNCSTKRWKRPSRRAILPRSPARTSNGNEDQQRTTGTDDLAVGAVMREPLSTCFSCFFGNYQVAAPVWTRMGARIPRKLQVKRAAGPAYAVFRKAG